MNNKNIKYKNNYKFQNNLCKISLNYIRKYKKYIRNNKNIK